MVRGIPSVDFNCISYYRRDINYLGLNSKEQENKTISIQEKTRKIKFQIKYFFLKKIKQKIERKKEKISELI